MTYLIPVLNTAYAFFLDNKMLSRQMKGTESDYEGTNP